MLINSLLLFIEETLPIFILYAYICAWHSFFDASQKALQLETKQVKPLPNWVFALKQDHHFFYFCSIVLGLLCSAILTHFRPWLGMTLEGIGYEILLIGISLSLTAGVIFGQTTNNDIVRKLLFSLSLFLLVLPHASDFTVFFTSIGQTQLYASVYVGISVGLGICISISYLLFFVFVNIERSLPLKLAIALFLAGQLSNIVTVLQQIDVLSSSLPLWNTNNLIADRNEYGQFFHVLIGYDATPTLIYLAVFGASTILIFTLLMRTNLIEGKSTIHGVVK
jgi:high-affinity iron transporter